MFHGHKYGLITEAVQDFPGVCSCFELRYADGEDLTGCPTWYVSPTS
jgi:hypothetical protein